MNQIYHKRFDINQNASWQAYTLFTDTLHGPVMAHQELILFNHVNVLILLLSKVDQPSHLSQQLTFWECMTIWPPYQIWQLGKGHGYRARSALGMINRQHMPPLAGQVICSIKRLWGVRRRAYIPLKQYNTRCALRRT